MARYNLFTELKNICKLEKFENDLSFGYRKMIQSGELSNYHYDYDTGYYDVSMFYIKYPNDSKHYCITYFGTIDDGDFGSDNGFETKEEALILLEKLKDRFENMVVCPSHEKLNEDFRDIGVFFWMV